MNSLTKATHWTNTENSFSVLRYQPHFQILVQHCRCTPHHKIKIKSAIEGGEKRHAVALRKLMAQKSVQPCFALSFSGYFLRLSSLVIKIILNTASRKDAEKLLLFDKFSSASANATNIAGKSTTWEKYAEGWREWKWMNALWRTQKTTMMLQSLTRLCGRTFYFQSR